jgi:autotransporter-associated beta strand protein
MIYPVGALAQALAAVFFFAGMSDAPAERFVWTGGGVQNQISFPLNWEGGVEPTDLKAAELVFGPGPDDEPATVTIDVEGIPASLTFEEGAPALTFVTLSDFPQLLALLGRGDSAALANYSSQPQTFKIQLHQLWVGGPTIRRWEAIGGALVFQLPVLLRGDNTTASSYAWEWVAESPITFAGGVSALDNWSPGSSLHVEKSGSGTVVLDGKSEWNGTLSVAGGPLVVNGAINLPGSFTVASGGTLAGSGTISAPVTVQGTLTPGDAAVGRLTFNQRLELAGTLELNLGDSPAETDVVAASSGPIVLGGRLVVRAEESALAAGKIFKVLEFPDGAAQGEFSSVELPPLRGGLKWQNNLAEDGTLMVTR